MEGGREGERKEGRGGREEGREGRERGRKGGEGERKEGRGGREERKKVHTCHIKDGWLHTLLGNSEMILVVRFSTYTQYYTCSVSTWHTCSSP